MDAVTIFIALGVVGLVIAVSSLLMGDVFDVLDGLFDAIDLGSGLFTGPIIGGFLAAFGFAAALTSAPLGTFGGLLVGMLSGGAVGGLAAWLTRSLMNMRTDPTPRSQDLVGRPGEVLLPLRPGSYGRVAIAAYGQRMQMSATADSEIPAGSRVVVVEVTSPTSVIVTPLERDSLAP
ncbi:MAG: NfeD family protein [Egibacteraceae bacterium]